MTDKEMLELAARAAGIEVTPHPNNKHDKSLVFLHNGRNWNPLRDPGDALRLAVALEMRMHHDGSCAVVELPTGQRYCWTESAVVEGTDHLAATMRAITMAAAEIGRAKT